MRFVTYSERNFRNSCYCKPICWTCYMVKLSN